MIYFGRMVTLKQKQIGCLVVVFVLFFVYIWSSRPTEHTVIIDLKDQGQIGMDSTFHDEFSEFALKNYNDLNIRLAREYQIDLDKDLWTYDR